ncbi:hypothetical protein PIIN_04892 [Serendipita indica DSM 11827]|uniref:Arrestin-like N-terminal domain-containing protein n=1 Tax=Serendipita indica (strain DSM 11827) TaxID=1109443 RepID=G4TI14_SERID|nr:hypothetical protein PIIN_04892 [Serendipita indica DSM 11827]
MPLNVEIVPLDNVLHMFGPQETDCAYSLSGQVLISTTPSRSAFNKESRAQPALLTSLVLTFEGSTEHFAKGQGYNATRLCSVSQTLVARTSTPVAIPSTPDHKVAIVFDLAIPGWLPASIHSQHATTATTTYRLYAKAVYQSEESTGLWLGSRTKYRDATPVPVTVQRHRTTAAPKKCTYAVPVRPLPSTSSQEPVIPKEVLSAVQVRATVPSYLDQKSSAPFDLRLDVGCTAEGVTVHKFGVRMIQCTTYGTTPDAEFRRRFPLPAEQPPSVPLLTPHELDSLFMAAICFPPNALRVDKDDILHPNKPSVFNMQEGEQGHSLDNEPSSITVPLFLDSAPAKGLVKQTYMSPYVHVAHKLLVDFDIGYNNERERVGFVLPIPVYDMDIASSAAAQRRPNDGLPAYVQLYHSNGEAKYTGDLPAYSKECRPGEVKDESGRRHPLEFRRRHLRGALSTSSSPRSSSEVSSGSEHGGDYSDASSFEC